MSISPMSRHSVVSTSHLQVITSGRTRARSKHSGRSAKFAIRSNEVPLNVRF